MARVSFKAVSRCGFTPFSQEEVGVPPLCRDCRSVLYRQLVFITSNKCFRAGIVRGKLLNHWTRGVQSAPHIGLSAVSRPFSLIPSRRYTTNVLPGYCPDDRPSTLHPFPLDSDGPEPRRYSP